MKAAKKATTTKKSTSAPAKKKDNAKSASSLVWTETKKSEQWVTTSIPEGELCTPRITRSSKNEDGSYSFFCYRNAKAIAVRGSLEEAKLACENPPEKGEDSVLAYVTEHAGEIPPFLLLTPEERAAVRKVYPHAAPSRTKTLAALERGDRGPEDPGTAKLRAELAAQASGKAGRAARDAAGAVPKPKKEALAQAQGKLVRTAKEGNPKKAGTGAHKRWEALFAACGGTVKEYSDAGHNMETLANAVAKGYVKIEESK